MADVLNVVKSQKLTYEQKIFNLAHMAEDTVDVLNVPEKTAYYFEHNAIDNLFEGSAPYRPRYILPDYDKFIKNGSEFLQIDPPKDEFDYCAPCGVCRQVMAEFCDLDDFQVILARSEDDYKIYSVNDLLPLSFTGKDIG